MRMLCLVGLLTAFGPSALAATVDPFDSLSVYGESCKEVGALDLSSGVRVLDVLPESLSIPYSHSGWVAPEISGLTAEVSVVPLSGGTEDWNKALSFGTFSDEGEVTWVIENPEPICYRVYNRVYDANGSEVRTRSRIVTIDFSRCVASVDESVSRAVLAGDQLSLRIYQDAEHPWLPNEGGEQGLGTGALDAGVSTAFGFDMVGGGVLSFACKRTGGSVSVEVDGVTQTIDATSEWADFSVEVKGLGQHRVLIRFLSDGDGEARIVSAAWKASVTNDLAEASLAVGSLDLSECWDMQIATAVKIPYSTQGWDVSPVPSLGQAGIRIVPVDGGTVVNIASDLTGRGIVEWTPDGVMHTTYRMEHYIVKGGHEVGGEKLTAFFNFEHLQQMVSDEELRAAMAKTDVLNFTVQNDADAPWNIATDSDGIVSPQAEETRLTVLVNDEGEFSFTSRITSGGMRVLVDGVEATNCLTSVDSQVVRLTVDGAGAHTIVLVCDSPNEAAIGVWNAVWSPADFDLSDDVSDVIQVDLRAGVRMPKHLSDILPFEYSSTNWVGDVALSTAASVARVTIVQLTGTDPDVRNWADEVPGSFKELVKATGESSVQWKHPHRGVWRATFDILNEDSSIYQESALFDLRNATGNGLVIMLK